MVAEIKNLKGRLKLNPQLAQLAGGGNDKGSGSKRKGKAKNKKDTSNKKNQKKDKAWKKVPPKDGKPKKKEHGDLTFHWCKHHMAWTVHKPADCKLGKKRAEEQKSSARAHSKIVAASTATTVNPHFAALIASFGSEDDK
jgi:hypothetical protein